MCCVCTASAENEQQDKPSPDAVANRLSNPDCTFDIPGNPADDLTVVTSLSSSLAGDVGLVGRQLVAAAVDRDEVGTSTDLDEPVSTSTTSTVGRTSPLTREAAADDSVTAVRRHRVQLAVITAPPRVMHGMVPNAGQFSTDSKICATIDTLSH